MEKEKIIEIAKDLRALKPFKDYIANKTRYAVQPVVDYFSVSCVWDNPEEGLEAFVTEKVCTFEGTHKGGPFFFRPSIAEVIESTPVEYIGKFNAFTVDYTYTPEEGVQKSEIVCYNVVIKKVNVNNE